MLSNRGLMAKSRQQPLEHRLLLTATFCLLAGGAVMVYSASSARTLLEGHGDGTAYLVKYLMYGAVGLVLMQLLARHGLEHVRRLTPLLLLCSFGLCVLVLLPGFGVEVNGARRWLGAGPLQFQPAELMKLALVLHAASVLSTRPTRAPNLRRVAGPILLPAACALLLIVIAQRDLGTGLVIGLTLAAVLVAAGLPLRQLALAAGAAAFVIIVLALLEPYRRARLTAFLNPWDHAGTIGFQAVQGQIAIGSGGLFGVGPGQSVQKVFYLPEAHTDFILAVIGEELGLAGICALLALYGMIGYAGLRTAKAAKGAYAKLLAAGLTSLILCQALLNIYTVLGLAPLTGVPLPFISSGSSSLITLLMAMGLLLNVAGGGSAHLRAVRPKKRKEGDERTADRDRGRRDRRARGAGHRGGRRAAG
jgi:cell division protein FtsW